jgi:hypothetical protein
MTVKTTGLSANSARDLKDLSANVIAHGSCRRGCHRGCRRFCYRGCRRGCGRGCRR